MNKVKVDFDECLLSEIFCILLVACKPEGYIVDTVFAKMEELLKGGAVAFLAALDQLWVNAVSHGSL